MVEGRTILGALLILSCPASADAGQRQNASIEPVIVRLEQQPEGYRLLQELVTKVGHRLTGSANGRRGEAFVFRKLRDAGYSNARFERFPITFWQGQTLDFRAGGRKIAASAAAYSPPRAFAEGELINAEYGNATEFERLGEKLRGKIALVRLGRDPKSPKTLPTVSRSQRVRFAIERGAAGVVFVNNQPNNVIASGTGSDDGTVLKIPVIIVGQRDDEDLIRQSMSSSVNVSISMTNLLRNGSARNVIASIPGTGKSNEHVVLGAHLDSWDLGVGALDNGANVMAVIEVARAMRKAGYRPYRTIDFIAFMGEEQGELGSRYRVAQDARAGRAHNIVYMLNADMIIDPRQYNTWQLDADRTFFRTLATRVIKHVPQFAADPMDRPIPGSDGQPYLENGTPVLYMESNLTRERMACYHAACDQLSLIDGATMRRTAVALALTIAALADAPKLPVERMTPEQTEAYLKRFSLKTH